MNKKYKPYSPRVKRKYVGSYYPKIDARQKAMGRTKYFDDVTTISSVPRMLHCAILNSPHANGTILSMDTTKAEALEGVRCILRYDDPEVAAMKPTTHSWSDTAITPYHRETVPRWWDRRVLDKTSRFVGDQMGVAVAADTKETAEKAISLIDIKWDVKPAFLEVDEAQKPEAAILHPEANPHGNQLPHREDLDGCVAVDDVVVDKGNVDKAFEESDVVIEVDKTYGGNSTHGCLDFRGCMIKWIDDRVEVWTNHYNCDQVRMHINQMLNVPQAKIRVHNTNCGAHMGKWNTGENIFFLVTAMLAKRTRCPVKYKMSVHEEFAEMRTMINFKLKIGAKNDGTITALYWDGIANNGAYTGVTGYALTAFLNAEGMVRLYTPIENVKMKSRVFFTNRIPGGVMRGIGNVQPCWALTQAVDEVAESLNMDPIDIYKKNFGNLYNPQPNLSVAAVLDAGAMAIGWKNRHKAENGELIDGCKKRGMGVSIHNQWHAEWQETMRGRVEISIRVNPDMSVILFAPTKETGCGANSAIVLACADLLNFLGTTPEDIVWVAEGDTEMGLRDVPPTNSVISFLLPEAMVGAAADVKREFIDRAALYMDLDADELDIKDAKIFKKSDPSVWINARDVMMEVDCVPITGRNIKDSNTTKTGIGYGAWFSEVEVDIETGKVEVIKLAIANDVGQVMHASGAESQQLGGPCMGMGEALSEELFYDKKTGTLLNNNYIDYKMMGIKDVPLDATPILKEVWKGAGEYGACGLAECTLTGMAAAIANALYNAVGIRINTVPITPRKVLEALAKKEMKEAAK